MSLNVIASMSIAVCMGFVYNQSAEGIGTVMRITVASGVMCVCVCVCAYSSPPCGRRRAGAYINAHDTFLFKRAIFEMILRQVQLSGELLQRFSVRANNV